MSAMFAGPYREGACQGCGRLNGVEAGGLCLDCRQIKNRALLSQDNRCRGCGELLDWRNLRVADMCPCNSGRGINHGLVPPKTCTCVECDPQQTGSTRYESQAEVDAMVQAPCAVCLQRGHAGADCPHGARIPGAST